MAHDSQHTGYTGSGSPRDAEGCPGLIMRIARDTHGGIDGIAHYHGGALPEMAETTFEPPCMLWVMVV